MAIFIGLIASFSQWAGIYNLEKNGYGLSMPLFYVSGDDLVYLAMTEEVLDGHGWAGSPYYYEHKNIKPLIPPSGQYLYAGLAYLFGLSAPWALIIGKFLFPALLFLLAHCLFKSILKENDFKAKLTSIAGALLVVFGYPFVDFTAVRDTFFSSDVARFNIWTRPVNPITGALFIFSFLILIWKIINKEREKRYAFFAAGMFSLMVLSYFFSWGLALAISGTLALFLVLIKDFQAVKWIALSVITGILITVPYWLGLQKDFNLTSNLEATRRNGLILTHVPIFNKVLLASLLVYLILSAFLFIKKELNWKKDYWWLFGLALVLGGLGAFNQQIITGRTIWPHHFVQYTISLSYAALILIVYYAFNRRYPRLWINFCAFIIIFCLGYGIFNEYKITKNLMPYIYADQKYSDVLSWVKQKFNKDDVILSANDAQLKYLIPAFTKMNVYEIPWAFYGTPDERRNFNFLVLLTLEGINPASVEDYLKSMPEEFRSYYFTDLNQLLNDGPDHPSWKEKYTRIEKISADYKEFRKAPLGQRLKKYRLDYVVSNGELNEWLKKELPEARLLEKREDYFVYSFKDNKKPVNTGN
ncbi:MAG: hypothetical protein WCW77_03515 [Patescibacteria group bacterium]